MSKPDDTLLKLYKQIESFICPIFEKYKGQFSTEEKADFEEMLVQCEYELMTEILLRILNIHSIELDHTDEDAVNQAYRLMEIERPVI